jgi:hypothetical protein
LISGAYLDTQNDMTWSIAGVGDFNADGNQDILWRNTSTGANYVWYMDGVTHLSGASIDTLSDLTWSIVGR